MSKPILFVCKSCRYDHEKSPDIPSDGMVFSDRLLSLYQQWLRRAELEIQPVRCLWTCDRPCAIALSSANKSTYLLANIPIAESSIEATAEAVLRFSELYLDSQDGNIVWKQFPEVLQTEMVARIPPSIPVTNNQS
ncbi:MAG TPA: DUF1636 domain-containing protein [Oculatellaceae cyanobacterium]|jgi:predicted metal-binding protein